jgi:NADPH:quinone reductase-like Zn-dependent oxidoreductase
MTAFVNQHRIVPVVDRVFPLAQATDAFRHMESSAQFGKLVLAVSP